MNCIKPAALILLATWLLSACAGMSVEECQTSDWHAIGFEDGSRGYSPDHLSSHRKDCAKHGVTPDFQAYRAGHEEGLGLFCQPSRGFSLGANGGSYNGVCAAHREGDFIDAYNSGYHLYNLRVRVNSATSQIAYKEGELKRNKDHIIVREGDLIAAETTIEERVMILSELKDLVDENGKLEAEIRQLIRDRAVHEQKLQEYESILADSGY